MNGTKKRFAAAPFVIELSVALLVFALVAASCASVFSAARQKSQSAARISACTSLAQSAADYLRTGDEDGFVLEFGAEATDCGYVAAVSFDAAGDVYTCDLSVEKTEGIPTRYSVRAVCGEVTLCALECAFSGVISE